MMVMLRCFPVLLALLIASIGPSLARQHSMAAAPAPATMDAIFTPEQLNLYVLQTEAALARAQASYGVIPASAAAEITRTAVLESVPADALAEENALVRHRMVALLNVWRRSLSAEAGDYLHYGATTVDIYDTARVLQLRQAIVLFIEDLRGLELQLIELAETHRDTPMIGRTLGQHALPITFGKKVSVWIGENRRNIERLTDLLDRVERSAIMKGAVGSYLGLGDQALDVEQAFSRELGMAPPYAADWHPARDVFAEYAGVLAIISRSWGRFGQEVFLLQTTDIAELVERRPTTAVGSSTLPHKNNPSLSEALMQRSRIIPRLAEIVGDDMINTFERDNTSRPNQQLDMISVETAQMLSEARRLVARLDVRTDTMRANLDRSGGWILSQRLVFALAPALGREHSEALMRELAASAIADGLSLRQALASNAEINETLSAQEIDALLDPATYLGQVGAQVDAVIAQARAAREADPVQ